MWKKFRKAVSPLLATIILIAITVAAGLVIYNLFFSTSGVASQTVQIMPDIKVIRPGGTASYALITISIKNTGSVAISGITVQWYPEGGTNLTSLSLTWDPSVNSTSPLSPGTSTSASTTITTNMPIVGKSYPFIIKATGTNGATYTWSGSVVCQG